MDNYKLLSLKKIKEHIEEYQTTVDALLCFVSLTSWDGDQKKEGVSFSFGRRMTTSHTNCVSPDTEQTPDLALQVSTEEAYIVEAKISLPKDKKYWEGELQQLRKYDDNLLGWWSKDGILNSHDLVLLIDISRSHQFSQFVQEYGGESVFVRPAAFIGFSRYQRVDENILFQLEWGKLSNSKLNRRVDDHIPIPLEKVIASFGSRKFYDAKPEPEYLMEIIWSHIFTDRKSRATYDDNLRSWPFDIEIAELTTELQRSFGNHRSSAREDAHPAISWVREAMDLFVALGHAVHKQEDKYEVRYKEFRGGDLIDRFAKARSKANQLRAKAMQCELDLGGKKTHT
jgi:hypothetical protein